MTPVAPYSVEKRTVGHLAQEEVWAVMVPRADFLAEVDRLIDEAPTDIQDGLRARLRPVAETMDRFPFSVWVHPSRGCGCLVGEYLIAADIIERKCVVDMEAKLSTVVPEDMADELISFGGEIDSALRERLHDNGAAMEIRNRAWREDSSSLATVAVFVD